MQRIKLFLITLSILLFGCSHSQAPPITPHEKEIKIKIQGSLIDYEAICHSVIRVGIPIMVPNDLGQWKLRIGPPHGTAFFICHKNYLYLVSARHVAETDHDLWARVQVRCQKTGKRKVHVIRLPRKSWVFHPNSGEADTHYVDVATMKVAF
ncbi:MAG: hypothetical protein SV375_00350 [Thermodesulfobacteriota bacterium]|nr:hypothetical protein [Thermodesulfobacteriota bacterium]